MKRNLLQKYLILILLLIIGTTSVWGQTEITFDISKSSVLLTDTNYSGKNSNGETVSGDHNPANKYIITGTTTENFIRVGDKGEANFVTGNFIIYLNGVNIKRGGKEGCACAVYNKAQSVVAIILKDGTRNILYSGYNRAGLEKGGGKDANGTLLITCEAGYTAWNSDDAHQKGHTSGTYNESACDANCGYLDARSGNAWQTLSGTNTYYHAGAGIGTSGEGTGGSSSSDVDAGNNALVNLTIAGGHITAAGTWGNTGGSSGGGASIGTGSASTSSATGGTIRGLKITGGNINAYRMDNSAACIGGGYRSGYVTMDIYGGTIKANNLELNSSNVTKMRAPAIGGGGGGNSSESPAGATVHIHNGKIEASGHYGSAIGSGAGGSTGHGQDAIIIIDNGDITAITNKGDGNGCGAAIGAGGSLSSGYAGNANITINGGKIVANSENGADIGGGGTNSSNVGDYGGEGLITITGGDITANTGGIGGGRANKGVGGNAEITISGENTIIRAKSIGGGRSKANTGGNVKLTVNGGTLTINDYIGGGIGGSKSDQIGWAKVYINGGTISGRTVMRATATDGCVFEMNGGTLTSSITDQPGGAVYMIDPNGLATLTGGTIQNCKGTTGGAVYMTGGTFTISGGNMVNNTADKNGAAVYLAGTGKVFVNGGSITGSSDVNQEAIYMSGGEFTMTAGTIKDFKGSDSGAVFMQGGTFTMTDGLIDNCSGTEAGAIYLLGGTFGISGGTISHCTGAQNGGAVYLAGTGTLNINGGNIKDNSTTSDGGAIYLNAGIFNMTGGKVVANTSQEGNGAGVYINNGTVSLTGGEVIGNEAIVGKGGGFYVAGGNVTLSNGTISSNKAKSAGGGICLEGTSSTSIVRMNVNGCKLTENEATEGNGGGIFLSNAEMTYNGGLLSLNKASYASFNPEEPEFKTGYKVEADNVKGIGGGIYISSNSKLTFGDFSTLGVYANTADISADDLFANGVNTSLRLPNIANMRLQNYAGNAQGLGWYEDYFTNDADYNITNIAKGNTQLTTFEHRFRVAQGLGSIYMRLYELSKDEPYRDLKDCYVSLALGFLFSDLTIRVQGLKPGESCVFNVTGAQTSRNYLIPVYGTQNQYDEQKIVKVPIDTYTVTLIDNWTWAYDIPAGKKVITKLNSLDGGIYQFDVEHKTSSITHDEEKISIKLE